MPPETYLPTGMDGVVTCQVAAQPPLLRVDWTKDGEPLDLFLVIKRIISAWRHNHYNTARPSLCAQTPNYVLPTLIYWFLIVILHTSQGTSGLHSFSFSRDMSDTAADYKYLQSSCFLSRETFLDNQPTQHSCSTAKQQFSCYYTVTWCRRCDTDFKHFHGTFPVS